MTLEYELVDANGGIQKVRLEPATRSAVLPQTKQKIFLWNIKVVMACHTPPLQKKKKQLEVVSNQMVDWQEF